MPATLNPSKPSVVPTTPVLPPVLVSTAIAPRPLLWNCEEFHRAGELGFFRGKRAMLINGVILEQGMMNPPHAIAIEMTSDAIRTVFGKGWRVRVQLPLLLGSGTDPEPDFAILPGSPQTTHEHPKTASFVIEVADTSLKYDTTEKAALYASAWIPEYWVIDTESRRLVVYRDPAATPDGPRYANVSTFRLTDSITPLAAPGATINVADLLK